MDQHKILESIKQHARFDIKGKKYPLYLADTTQHGIGLFTDQKIKKNEIVTVLRGRILPIDDDQFEDETNIMINLEEVLLADSPVLRFLNHSCQPNLKITGTRTLTTLRDIQKNEQLTIDYSTSEHSDWVMDVLCKCGEPNCRQKIVGIGRLDDQTYQKLLHTIPKNLRRK